MVTDTLTDNFFTVFLIGAIVAIFIAVAEIFLQLTLLFVVTHFLIFFASWLGKQFSVLQVDEGLLYQRFASAPRFAGLVWRDDAAQSWELNFASTNRFPPSCDKIKGVQDIPQYTFVMTQNGINPHFINYSLAALHAVLLTGGQSASSSPSSQSISSSHL